MALTGQRTISSGSSLVKSFREGIENPSNLVSGTDGFWVLATNSGIKEKDKLLQPSECPTAAVRACSSPTLFAEARAKRKTVFRVRFLSEDLLRGSYGGPLKDLKTRETSH